MAIARTGSIVGALSGGLGSVVFANTKQGLLIKHRPVKIKHDSEKLLKSQALVQYLQGYWASLTKEQHLSWSVLAESVRTTNRLGLTSSPSGHRLFLTVNLRLLRSWHIPLGVAPPKFTPTPMGNVSLTFTTTPDYTITTDLPDQILPSIMMIYGSRPFKSHRISSYNRWTFLFWQDGGLNDFRIDSYFNTKLGVCAEGEWVGVKLINSYLGYWWSAPRIFSVQVTAP